MGKRQSKQRRTGRQQQEVIHFLNQRYHEEFLRAERNAADAAMMRRLRLTYPFRALRWLKRKLTSILTRRSSERFMEPLTMAPVELQGRVSIIIPFRDRLELLRECIYSLCLSTYRNYEVILVDNGSTDPQMARYLKNAGKRRRYHVVEAAGPFNFSHLCNRGAEQAVGSTLLFLNNDTMVLTPDWLEQMLRVQNQPGVGVVGAMLCYPDGTVQHAGMYQQGDVWEHYYRGQSPAELRAPSSVPAVSGACLMIPRDLFLQIHGFDESLPIVHNDTDLCQRARKQGHKVAIAPQAMLLHYESVSRGFQIET